MRKSSTNWMGPILAFIVMVIVVLSLTAIDQDFPSRDGEGETFLSLVSQGNLLERIANTDGVVFVDAREAAEYHEEHIPGAVNLVLRDVSRETVKPLLGKAAVVAYCLKDFRGIELAKALSRAGVENVHVMEDFGINGWKGLGLPTTGGKSGLSEAAAIDKLSQCARTRICLKTDKA